MVQEEYKEDTVTLMGGHLPGEDSVVGVESYIYCISTPLWWGAHTVAQTSYHYRKGCGAGLCNWVAHHRRPGRGGHIVQDWGLYCHLTPSKDTKHIVARYVQTGSDMMC